MTAVRTTLNHSIGEDFSVKVTATNGKGTSELSTQSNTIAAQDVPQGKVTIDSNFTTTTSSVSISWTALTQNSDTGYSDITNYTITYSNTSAATNTGGTATSSTTSATISNLDEGATYQFVVTPTNVHGTGTNASDALSAVPAARPSQMSKVRITQAADSTSVTFTWDRPTTNGLPITAYTILLFSASTNTYAENAALCNGTSVLNAASAETTTYSCNIAMTDITGTLGYSAGAFIKAKAKASNDRGSSDESEASDDSIKAQVAPTAAPSGLNGTATKDSITLT